MAVKVWSAKAPKGIATLEPLALTARQQKRPSAGLSVKLATEGDLPDNFAGAGWPIVSAKLRDAIKKVVAAYPVKLKGLDGKVMKAPYFLLDASNVPNCIDWKKCEMVWAGSRHNSPIVAFDKIVLHGMNSDAKELLFGGPNLFGVLFVREALVKKLKVGGFVGLHFEKPSDVSRVATGESPAEAKEKKRLIALAEGYAKICAAAVTIDAEADLAEQADDWWYQDGVASFEGNDVELPEAWSGTVGAAYRQCWVNEAKKRIKKK